MILAQPPFPQQNPKSKIQNLKSLGSLVPTLLICLCLGMTLLLCSMGAAAQSATGGNGARPSNLQSNQPSNQIEQPSHIKSDLKEILSEPEFRPASTEQGLITRTLETMRTQLETWWHNIRDFFRRLFGGGGGNSGMVNVGLVYFLIGLIAVGAGWALVRIIAARGRRPRKPTAKVQAVTLPPMEEGEPQRAPDDWIAEADRMAHNSDFRAAFRAVFLAILVQLDRAGKIEYRRSRTNGDYLRALRAHSLRALYELLAPLTREFDLRWYGGHPANEADYQRCLDAYRRLPAVITTNADDAPPTQTKGG
jgi:hypothetical protein